MNEKRGLAMGPGKGFEKDLPPQYPYDTSTQPSNFAPNPAFRTTFACVSMHMTDRIRLLRFPARDVQLIQDIIRHAWPRGIQNTRVYDAANEIKLYGNPWSSSSWSDQKTDSRRLICRVLNGLFDMGWVLKASVDISKKEYDKGMLVMYFHPCYQHRRTPTTNKPRHPSLPLPTTTPTPMRLDVHLLRPR
jgi:hypothetical protein